MNLWNQKKQKGFTLVEMAISIIVIGLIIGPLLLLYDNYAKQKKIETTYTRTQIAADLIQQYRNANGHYPCPAPMNVARKNASYGKEFMGGGASCFANAPAVKICKKGVCSQQSIRATNTLPAGVAFDKRVLVGALPFRALQMTEKDSLDAYGNRILYAVTLSLANGATLDDRLGGITIVDSGNQSLTAIPGAGHFLVVSPGPNGRGAYTIDGVRKFTCASAAKPERGNCDDGFETGKANTASVFVSMPRSDKESSQYDDVVVYYSQIYSQFWAKAATDGDIHEIVSGNIAIGKDETAALFTDPGRLQPTLQIYNRSGTASGSSQINSLVIATEDGKELNQSGALMADQFCDTADPPHCFSISDFAEDKIGCQNPGEYIVGIQQGHAICDKIAIKCPEDQPLFSGIDAQGSPICMPIPTNYDCPPMTLMSACNVAVEFGGAMVGQYPPMLSGGTYHSPLDGVDYGFLRANFNWADNTPVTSAEHSSGQFKTGACKGQKFQCKIGPDGTPHYEEIPIAVGVAIGSRDAGTCDLEKEPWVDHTASCASQDNYVPAPGNGSGNYTWRERTLSCYPKKEIENSTINTDCACAVSVNPPAATQTTRACSDVNGSQYWTGNVITTTTTVAGTNCAPTQQTTNDSSNCQCAGPGPSPQTRTIEEDCPQGFAGHAIRTQTFNYANNICNWQNDSSTEVDNSQCLPVCDPPATQVTREEVPACAADACQQLVNKTTYGYRREDYDMTTCTAGPEVKLSDGYCQPRNDTRWQVRSGEPTQTGTPDRTAVVIGSTCNCNSMNHPPGGTPIYKTCYHAGGTSGSVTLYSCTCQ